MSNSDNEFKRVGDSISEYLETLMNKPASSEDRFDSLANREKAVATIIDATRSFEKSRELTVLIPTRSDSIPKLSQGSTFKYDIHYGSYVRGVGDGEDFTFVIVCKESVIAFGFGEVPFNNETDIRTIDVETQFRRSIGWKSTVQIEGQSFDVGVGHVLVLGLIDSIKSTDAVTEALNPQSRYIFKSLGFVSTWEKNSCLLKLRK